MPNVIGEFVAKIGADMGGFERGVDSADKKMGGFAAGFAKHRKAIGVGITAMGGAIVGALGLAMKSAADFEAGMREVNTMMGLGQVEFEAMSKDVLQLTSDLGINAVEATKALYQAISAGVPKENVLTFLEIASIAAIGGVTDTTTSVDGLTTVLNAFNLEMDASRGIADIMFATVAAGKTTYEELSASIGMVAPAAAAMGVEVKTLFAMLATMTKQGIDTARATTSLNAILTALMKPTTEMAAALKELGFESADALIEEVGLAKGLDLLVKKAGGSKEMLGKMFGSVEAIKGIFALTGDNAEILTADLGAMERASDGVGASQEAANEVMKGAAWQFGAAKEKIGALAIEIGGKLLPQLVPLIEKVGEVVSKVSVWMEANPQLTETIVKIVAVVGGLMLVLGPLLIMLPSIAAAFTLLLGPVGLVILAVAALVAAGIALHNNWELIWRGMKRVTETVVNFIIGLINNLIDVINLIPFANISKIGQVGMPTQALSERAKAVLAGMPKGHGGGIVPGRPGQEVPILAEAGEVIEPVGAEARGVTFIQNFEGSLISEREVGEIVQRELLRLDRLNYTTGIS